MVSLIDSEALEGTSRNTEPPCQLDSGSPKRRITPHTLDTRSRARSQLALLGHATWWNRPPLELPPSRPPCIHAWHASGDLYLGGIHLGWLQAEPWMGMGWCGIAWKGTTLAKHGLCHCFARSSEVGCTSGSVAGRR